uniref:ShKT domain-containing protein n=1 Tax=Plectus sambesii TaxID=2011161 RepID=A0A914VTB0_9BILA
MASASVLKVLIAALTLSALDHAATAQESSVSTPYSQQNVAFGQYRPNAQTTYTQLSSVSSSSYCTDQLQKCSVWASTGECNTNPTYMHAYCKQSCGDCNGGSSSFGTDSAYGASRPITPVAVGYNAVAPVSSSYGRGSGTYLGGLTGSYGYGSTGYGSTGYGSTGYGSNGYGNNGYGNNGYGNTGYGNTGYGSSGYGSNGYGNNGYGSSGYGSGQPLSTHCIDLHAGCANWAAYGHCTINPTYMLQYCRQSCGSCGNGVSPTYPQQPYLGQGSNGYGSGYIQPTIQPTYGGIQQPINNGYIQPQPTSYGQTSSGYGQTSSGYGQTSSGYGQAESTYSQHENTNSNSYNLPESRPSGYNTIGTSYVSPTETTGEYNNKKDKKLVAAKN